MVITLPQSKGTLMEVETVRSEGPLGPFTATPDTETPQQVPLHATSGVTGTSTNPREEGASPRRETTSETPWGRR